MFKKINFSTIAVFLISLILLLIIISIVVNSLSSNNGTPNIESISAKFDNLKGNLKQVDTDKYSIDKNIVIVSNDGTILYVVYNYTPTADNLQKIADYFKVDVSKIIITGNEYQSDKQNKANGIDPTSDENPNIKVKPEFLGQ